MENERLKLVCHSCKKNIYLTINSKKCPNCGTPYNEEAVKHKFYELETLRANSKMYQAGVKLENTGKGMGNVGKSMNSLGNSLMGFGCLIILLTILFFFILIII